MKHLLFALILGASTAQAQSYEKTPGGIWIPPSKIERIPAPEISAFENEWCANNANTISLAKQVCFGRVEAKELKARALLFVLANGERALYFESEPPAVELRKLKFKIYGPASKRIAELGEVVISIDERGEVNGVEGSTPNLGRISVVRPE